MSAGSIVLEFLKGYQLSQDFTTMRFEDMQTHIRTFVSKQRVEREKINTIFGYMYWLTDDDWNDVIHYFWIRSKSVR